MNKNTKIIWKPIDGLIPYEHNAKEHNKTQIKNLAKSLEEYGWQTPILIDKENVIEKVLVASFDLKKILGFSKININDEIK